MINMEDKDLSPEKYLDVVFASSAISGEKASPFVHRGLKKSLEVINSSSKKSPTLLENLLSDKAQTLKASVNAMLEEVQLREDLNASHFGKIDGEVSRLRVELRNLENGGYSDPGDLSGVVDEERVRIGKEVLELERERRSEGLECWRDLMFLRKYLMGALKDYWELVRRRGVLGEI